MVIITDYQLISSGPCLIKCCNNAPLPKCPVCGSLLFPRDSRKRIMKKYGGIRTNIQIRRLKCRGCGRVHSELPDILLPYKHYIAEVIENVLDYIVTPQTLSTEDYPCEETMKRWHHWFQNIALQSEDDAQQPPGQAFPPSWTKPALQAIRRSGAGWLSLFCIQYSLHPPCFAQSVVFR